MTTIIRATDRNQNTAGVAFNFDDMADQARQYLDKVRAEAGVIIAQARQEAAGIRQKAEQEGRQAAMAAMEQAVERQLGAVLPALRKAIGDIHQAKQAWLAHWEAAGIHVASQIARRLIRRELTVQPDIPLTLLREALALAAGSPQVRIHLNPNDLRVIDKQAQVLVQEMAGLGEAQLVADAAITPGGCRVETRFGVIDQQFEAQLARVEEELKA